MQWLKSIFRAPVTTKAIPITPAQDYEVPRYPPFAKGLPAVEPERLLAQHPEILAQYKRSVIVPPEQYEKFYLGALRRFASYAHLLPASQTHHHRGAGGLLRHSMEVALWSLQGADNMLLSMGKTPAQRRSIEPRWQLTAFLAGLCHDVGKPATDMTITNGDRELTWKPLAEDLYEWARRNNIKNYFLDWRAGRGKQHVSLSNLLAERIIGTDALQWIDEGGTELVVWLMEALSGNPGATNPLYDLVIRADSASTERDLKTMGVAMAGYELGVPIERHLMDIIRRLIKEGIWQINELGARVWNINGGIYLVWPASGEEIATKVRQDDLKGFPRTADGILDLLIERGLAFVRDSGDERYWKVVPAVLEAKIPNKWLACIRLRDDAMISSTPIAAVPGRLINEEVDEEDVATPSASQSQEEGEEDDEDVPSTVAAPAQPALNDPPSKPTQGQQTATATAKSAPQIREPHQVHGNSLAMPVETPSSRVEQEEAQTPVAPGKFSVDPETGEILGVESGDPSAKKKPALRELARPESGEGKQGISKPTAFKIKTPLSQSAADAAGTELPPAATGQGSDAPTSGEDNPAQSKKKRKKSAFLQPPELKFAGAGSVGELFLALAEDLIAGDKLWGRDVRVDDEQMVLLRWPASFANYGLTAKVILEECAKFGWIWVDQDNPMVKLQDAKFEGEECKALRLMPEPGDALLYHAKYGQAQRKTVSIASAGSSLVDPQTHAKEQSGAGSVQATDSSSKPAPNESRRSGSGPKTDAQLADRKVDVAPDAQERVETQKTSISAPPMHASTEQPPSAPNGGGDLSPEKSPRASAGQHGKIKPPNGNEPLAESKVSNDAEGQSSLLKVIEGCEIKKNEGGWIYVDKRDLCQRAIAGGFSKDRKEFNVYIEAHAKLFRTERHLIAYRAPVQ